MCSDDVDDEAEAKAGPGASPARVIAVATACLAAVALAVLVGVLALGRHDAAPSASASVTSSSATTPSAESPSETTPPPSPSPSEDAQQEVPAEDKSAAGEVLREATSDLDAHAVPGASDYYGYTAPSDVLPEGSTLDVDESTWTRLDDHTVMVKVTVTRPGEAPVDYAALMARNGSDEPWQIVGTLDWAEQ